MSGPLGLSIGTTNLVAARVGNQPVSRRSVLTLSTDRTPEVGVPESGHGVPLSGFVERIGDPVPLVAPDGSSYPADTLLVEALDAMVELVGGPSEQLAIAVPAHWGAPTLRALRNALRTNPSLSRDGMPARLIPDAVASLAALRANPGLPSNGVVALLDFGGGGTSITLADAASSFEPIDETTRYPDFSGDQIDQALLTHVLDGVAEAGGIDPAGTAAVGSLARLREECRQAKERLSADTATDLVVELPGYSAIVRVTRTELESLMQAPLAGVLDALENALERNRINWSAISAVVTIGGGASIPLVTQQLSSHSRAAVVTTPQPALDAAIGAALSAAYLADADAQTGMAPTGMAPTMGSPAALSTAGIPTDVAGSAVEDSSAFRALAWSEDDAGDDVVPYTGPDVMDSYGSETAARPAVQYVPPTGPIEQQSGGWQRLPLTVFAVAAALVLVAIGGVTYALTSATGTAPTTPVKTAEPKPLPPQEVAPSPVAPPPPVEPPPAPEPPVTQAPPPVTVTQAPPPPPVTETHVVTKTTTPPPVTTTTTTTTVTTTTTPPPTTTTTTPTPTTTTTTTNPMTTTYVTVPFVPVPIPIQVPNRGETQQPQYPYQQQPQYPYQQQPQNPFQPYP